VAAARSSLFVSHFSLGHHSSSFRHRRQNRSTLFQQRFEDREIGDAHVFLRFSPLIGGPSFLPLHVEVIVAVDDSEKIKEKMDTIYIRKVNNLSSTSFLKEPLELHRFDFLPVNPSSTSTLVQLLTLNGVPGKVRHRIYERISEESNNMQTEVIDTNTTNQDGSGITILLPVGSLPCIDDKNVSANEVVSTAMQFKEDYSDTLYKELRILGGKNCLSYALDLLSHVEFTTGIQRITRLSKLDIQ